MYISILSIIALTSATVSAGAIQGRGLPGGVYACTGTNFQGNCAWYPPSGECKIAGGDSVKSVGPDEGTTCTLYKGSDCNEAIKMIHFPGETNVQSFESMRCGVTPAVEVVPVNIS